MNATVSTNVEKVPPAVRIAIERALEYLREIADRLEAGRKIDVRFSGGGRYESECLLAALEYNVTAKAREILARLAEFRTLAPGNGVDPEAFLAELGGVPNIKPSARALAYLSDDNRYPLPANVAAYLQEIGVDAAGSKS